MITYQPSPHFKHQLRDFDRSLAIKWVESTETLELWAITNCSRPVLEHSYVRNGKRNWDMEWIVLMRLIEARRFQHESAQEFQDNMLDKQAAFRAKGEAEADEMMHDFMSDPYYHKKRLQEFEDNDFGACTTQWSGASTDPGGTKNDANMESNPL